MFTQCYLLSQRLAQFVIGSNKTRFLVSERIKTVFAVIRTDAAVTDTTKWQFFN